jgi:predicted Zn-dependent protease
MSPIKILALPGGFRIHVRGWPALFALLALIAVPVAARWYRTRPAPPRTVTRRDLQQMEAQYQRKPRDAHTAVDLLLAYAEFVANAGSLLELVASIDKLAETAIESGGPSRMIELRARNMKAAERCFEQLGIASPEELEPLRRRAVELATETPLREDLSRSERAAAHVAAAQIFLQAHQPDRATEELTRAQLLDADPVIVGFVRVDILTQQKRYAEAIAQLRQTSLDLTAWAERPPSLEQRLLWNSAMRRPGRFGASLGVELRERHWRQRKERLAHRLREAIRDEVQALQAQEKLEKNLHKWSRRGSAQRSKFSR